jgi:cytoskeletal protein CcmA (bactofilin family)
MPSRQRRRPTTRWTALGLLLAPLLLGAAATVPASASAEPARVVPPNSRVEGDLTALGRDLDVSGTVAGTVVATRGSIRVSGHVTGSVVAVGGDVTIPGEGRVDGDVLALGGDVRFEGTASAGRSVGGTVRSLGALESTFLAELRTSPVAGAAVSPLLLSFRVFLLLLWLAAALVLLRLQPRTLGGAADTAPDRVVTLGAIGTSAVLSGLLLSAGLLLAIPARIGLVLAAAVAAALYGAKVWGLAAISLATGRRLLRSARRGSPLFGDPAAMTAGLLALGLPSLVPVFGPLLWAVVSLVAIGAAARTLVRRQAPEPAASARAAA